MSMSKKYPEMTTEQVSTVKRVIYDEWENYIIPEWNEIHTTHLCEYICDEVLNKSEWADDSDKHQDIWDLVMTVCEDIEQENEMGAK